MCLNPIKIRNKNRGRNVYCSDFGESHMLPLYMTSQKPFITVPCGKCAECKQSQFNGVLQRATVESFSSYLYFITLTYDNNHIPSIEIDGETFLFADYNDIQNMFKRFRASGLLPGNRDFRYLAVNEYGDKKHRPHFHLILFVAKLESDDDNVPRVIEKILFDNLGNYFARNVGTRKDPIYEKLFTYKFKYTSQGVKTNYFVKYVEPFEFDSKFNSDTDISYIKTIRYLIGYINKPSKYEDKIELFINRYKDNPYMYRKLRHLLRSQVRYSKGFGCGFTDDGKKHYLKKISVRASHSIVYYSELVDNLPSDFDEFKDCYPDLYEELCLFIKKDYYARFDTWKECLLHMHADTFKFHCLYLNYFKEEFAVKYRNFKDVINTRVAYFFDFTHRKHVYDMAKVKTYKPDYDSKVFQYLADGVQEGINQKVPYLAFKMVGEKRFTSLCRYYRERVCTTNTLYRFLHCLGCKNYDEWFDAFIAQKSTRVVDNVNGNTYKYQNDDEVDCLDDLNSLRGSDIYLYLFNNEFDINS